MKIELLSKTENKCDIFTLKFDALIEYLKQIELKENSVCYIVDKNLASFPQYKLLFKGKKVFFYDANEGNKNIDKISVIYDFLLENKEDRKSFVIGIGGGITLDVTGFVASTYMRGIRFGFVPTTFLAMVDASIGGKNGVNFRGYKNYIGTFNHPKFVAVSPYFLNTLNDREFKIGMSEVIKYSLISRVDLLDFINIQRDKIICREISILEHLIKESIKTKVDIVKKDFNESGLRKILNFGHTLGHALERIRKVSHGEGVAVGMVFAGYLSLIKGYISERDFSKIKETIHFFRLPLSFDRALINEIINGISGDKKKSGDKIDFVLLKKLGHAVIEPMDLSEIRDGLENMLKYC